LIDALADGSLPADEIKTRLTAEKARKTVLSASLDKLGRLAKIATADTDDIACRLRTRVTDVAGVLGRQTVQARQMLRKILADKIELEPVGQGRGRGYKFQGILTIEKLLEGDAMHDTSDSGGPNGIRTRVSVATAHLSVREVGQNWDNRSRYSSECAAKRRKRMVGRDGIEPPTPGFSVLCSTN